MKKAKYKNRMTYEPEADVFSMEIAGSPIDYAKEFGNVVVHFTKQHTPVIVEILDASKFLEKARGLVIKKTLRKSAAISR